MRTARPARRRGKTVRRTVFQCAARESTLLHQSPKDDSSWGFTYSLLLLHYSFFHPWGFGKEENAAVRCRHLFQPTDKGCFIRTVIACMLVKLQRIGIF